MRQLTLIEPRRLEWIDAPEPRLGGADAALVRPVAATMCDVDPVIIDGRFPLPMPVAIGHEFVAEIVELGSAVREFSPGQQVVVPFQISCGECDRCAAGLTAHCRVGPPTAQYGHGSFGGDFGGAFSDLVRVPFASQMLVALPDGLSPTQAASVGDCVCDGWRSVAPHLREKPGSSVLVIGGCGSIPLYAVDVATALGSTEVDYLDVDPTRLAIAEKLGARVTDSDIPDRFGEYGVIVNGAFPAEPGLACALRSLVPDGVCVSVSWQLEDPRIPLAQMYRCGVRLHVSRVNARPIIPEVLKLMEAKRIRPEWVTSDVLPWEQADRVLLEPPMKPVFVREPVHSS